MPPLVRTTGTGTVLGPAAQDGCATQGLRYRRALPREFEAGLGLMCQGMMTIDATVRESIAITL